MNIHKDELKVKEYNMFKAYYCGLCFALKENFGNIPRLTLSYDVTFLCLLLSSLFDETEKISPKKCISNPLKSRPVCVNNEIFDYCSAINVILTHYKLKDDLADGFSVKSFFLSPLFLASSKKAKKLYEDIFSSIGDKLEALSELEGSKCGDIDKVSDVFAGLLGEIFSYFDGLSSDTKRILQNIGYSLGRFIYILDAYDDLDEDKKKNRYNPFIFSACHITPRELKQSLMYTLSDISLSYELLDIKKNKNILDNIIYMGLTDSLDKVFSKKQKENND